MLPIIMGRMPNSPSCGFQITPVRNFSGRISAMAGNPLTNRNPQISTTARMDTQAATRKTTFIMDSRYFFMNVFAPL